MKHRQPKREDWRMKPAKKRIVAYRKYVDTLINRELINMFCNSSLITTVNLSDGTYRHTIEYTRHY